MATTTRPVQTLKVGDVILPPAREMSLWMRRVLAEKGLPESALYLTITDIREADADARGRWVTIGTLQDAAWCSPLPRQRWTFKARPQTLWPVVTPWRST